MKLYLILFIIMINITIEEKYIRKCIFEDHKNNNSELYFCSLKSNNVGVTWLEASNICIVDDKKANALVYIKKTTTLEEDVNTIMINVPFYKRTFSMNIGVIDNPYSIKYNEVENLWIGNNIIRNHFIHFLNTFKLIWNAANDDQVPPINTIFWMNYDRQSELEFSYLFQKILLDYYYIKKNRKINELNPNGRKYKGICFKKANLILEVNNNNFLTIFDNKYERRVFRDFVLDYMKINSTSRLKEINNKKTINISIIYRNTYKNIKNRMDLYKYLSSICKLYENEYKFHIQIISFDNLNPLQQINIILYENIIISPQGTSLGNILWLINDKIVIIESFQFGIYRSDFMRLSISIGYLYFPYLSSIPVYNRDSYNFSCKAKLLCDKGELFNVYYNGYFYSNIYKCDRHDQIILLKQIQYFIYKSIRYLTC